MNRARRRLTSVIEPITMSERRIPYIFSHEFAQDGVNIDVKNGETTALRGSEVLMNYTAAADPEHGSGWRRGGGGGKGEMIRGFNPRELHGLYTLCEICNVTIGDLSS